MAANSGKTRWGLILFGLCLAGLSAAWFLTPLSTMVVDAISGGGDSVARTAAKGARPDKAAWDMLNTALDAANAFFGAVGLFMTLRGLRGQKQRQG